MKRLIPFLIIVCFSIQNLVSQTPDKISYQSVLRNSAGELMKYTEVTVRISIIQNSPEGGIVYSEIHNPLSNENGLISLEIGTGTTGDDLTGINWIAGPYFLKTEVDPEGGLNFTISGNSQILTVPYAFHARTAEEILNIPMESDPVFVTSLAAGITAGDTTYWNQKQNQLTGNETIFDSWDKNASDDFTGDYGSLSNVPDLSDTSIYIKEETQGLTEVLAINNLAGRQIKDLREPIDGSDAATKFYVDALKKEIEFLKFTLLQMGGIYLTSETTGIMKDIDGNEYKAVKIGNQWWMAENLRVTHFADAKAIPKVVNKNEWFDLLYGNKKGYCYYENDSSENAQKYGALYSWGAAMNGAASSDSNPSGIQGICPDGWHLPSDEEWKEMEMYLGMSRESADSNSVRGTDEGSKLKSTSGWLEEGNGSNSTGFNALPGGRRTYSGKFESLGSEGYWWTSTELVTEYCWFRRLSCYQQGIARYKYFWNHGYSVRCVKD